MALASPTHAEHRVRLKSRVVMEQIEISQGPEMHRRQIELPDGRYLLFFTFDTTEDENEPGTGSEVEIAANT